MPIRPSPPSLITSTQPFLHCCETWHVHAARGEVIQNWPTQQGTWNAIEGMQRDLLTPLEERFGLVTLTYGFAGPELVKAIKKRAAEGGWLPNISPAGDQHAGHELNTHGKAICKRGGIAADLRVPGVSSEDVAAYVIENLPFDRIYLYSAAQAFHLGWVDPEFRIGQVIRMIPTKSGGLVPKVVIKGRSLHNEGQTGTAK